MSGLFSKFGCFLDEEKHCHSHSGHVCDDLHEEHASNRFQSFVPPSSGNIKWFVDGASYFWAVSEAFARAEESIYILDWWLSPELYLRRPPAKNEKYRLDVMIRTAAERGVKVNVIVYKEVEAALTLNSAHTKHALEALHPNVRVFRHPDHTPTGYDFRTELNQNIGKVSNFDLATVSKDAIKALYGAADDIVLYWAHHEKLIIVDRHLVFMGGLDLCFGRWDTNSHPIADAHPGDIDQVIFPGQDYNNARIFDFADVGNWNQNKLDRTKSSRMGWSDVALSMNGPIVDDLVSHFVDRWNFMLAAKYGSKDPGKYEKLHYPYSERQTRGQDDRGEEGLLNRFTRGISERMENLGLSQDDDYEYHRHRDERATRIQLTRSCTKWSSGHSTEHSIANAYVDAIRNAEHFIYIENQFFITATDDAQKPVTNKIGAAIVERILRAYNENTRFKVLVVMPAVPAFAGDLKSKEALGTRAIMEYQYKSISRGGHSIMDKLSQAGISNVYEYIGFFNLRNYDRINTSKAMGDVEQRAGVSYEQARRQRDEYLNAESYEYDNYSRKEYDYDRYQKVAADVDDPTLDTVSSCYMDSGRELFDARWIGDPEKELDSFVSEQLYIHTKLLIADDRLVICGSANLNDRSQLGTHDSEIAVVIEGPAIVDSRMNGSYYKVSEFAASLRRQIFRKHLGLLPDQVWDQPNQNWEPINMAPNGYDWGSENDIRVQDPLSFEFMDLWDSTARENTRIFSRAFHPVPDDKVRNWEDYDEFFSRHFVIPSAKNEGEKGANSKHKVDYGHIVKEEFPGGVREVKDWLGRIRGNLVNMPLDFLIDVKNLAEEGLALNGLTQELYT